MRCPYCGFADTKVTDSRDADDGIHGRREEFSRDKLLEGLRKACQKRPLPAGTVEAVADAVETSIRQSGAPEVASAEIGEVVMERLRELDHIAYIRFASVYRDFADVEDLQRELQALASRGTAPGPGAGQPTLLAEQELKELTRGVRVFPTRTPRRRGRPAGGKSRSASQPTPIEKGVARRARGRRS